MWLFCHQNKALGEVMMKRLIMTSVILITMFGLVGPALAVSPATSTEEVADDEIASDGISDELKVLAELEREARMRQRRAARAERQQQAAMTKIGSEIRPDMPYILISATPDKLNLGTTLMDSEYNTPAMVTVHINSNCEHGSVIATMSSLKNEEGTIIKSDRIFVQSPTTEGYASMEKPVVISKPADGTHSVDLSFKVETDIKDRAGKYEGSLMFTVVPPS